jgi:hypothetical protein
VPVRTVWPSEAADFTSWLGGNLDFLDELGLGQLALVEVEAQLPGLGRSLDILAETADGRRVAIENQYQAIDHDHLTRGLAYAVGHEARALVVIAEEHRPEFVAVADYLNRCQEAVGDEHGIAVFLVSLSVERITDAYVPRFTVQSQPDAWRAAVLIDRDAVASGAAANGEPWQYYDLGHGFCGYTFFEQCPHRMACAKCDFYTPKDSSKALLLEAKDNLQRMLTSIALTDDERAAVDDGRTALDQLLTRLTDIPTPAGPVPRQLGTPATPTLLPIVDVRQGTDSVRT